MSSEAIYIVKIMSDKGRWKTSDDRLHERDANACAMKLMDKGHRVRVYRGKELVWAP